MITFPHIDPVALDLGFIQIHWYGLMYLFAILGAWHLGNKRAHTIGWTHDDVGDFIFYATLGIVAGGRIGYMLFYQPGELLADPLSLIRFWQYDELGQYQFTGIRGMSFHGGLLGVIAMCLYFARKKQCHMLTITDFIAPLAPIGLALGRLGNFINGELWGRVSDVPWAMVFPVDNQPRHPSQLYEFGLEGVLLFIVLYVYTQSPRERGQASGLFLIGYGLSRFIVEFFREPDFDQGFIAFGWLTKGQLLSIPMILIGVLLWLKPTICKRTLCNNI